MPYNFILMRTRPLARIISPVGAVLHALDPRGAAINFVEDNLISIATAGYMCELASLIGEYGLTHLISCDEDIMLLLMILSVLCLLLGRDGSMLEAVPSSVMNWDELSLLDNLPGGLNILAMTLHVPFMCLL